jgi:hypothetical protein
LQIKAESCSDCSIVVTYMMRRSAGYCVFAMDGQQVLGSTGIRQNAPMKRSFTTSFLKLYSSSAPPLTVIIIMNRKFIMKAAHQSMFFNFSVFRIGIDPLIIINLKKKIFGHYE